MVEAIREIIEESGYSDEANRFLRSIGKDPEDFKRRVSECVEIDGEQPKESEPQPARAMPRAQRQSTRDRNFGKLFQDIFTAPEMCELGHTALKVYLYLLAHRNADTGLVSPSYANILDYLNRSAPRRARPYSEGIVTHHIQQLEKRGLAKRQGFAYRGHAQQIKVAARASEVGKL